MVKLELHSGGMKPLWPLLLLVALVGCASPLPASPVTGDWRSNQAEMTLNPQGGTIEFGCASGTIGAVNLDAKGEFKVAGTFTQGSPVIRIDDPPPTPQPVTYTGSVAGNTLTFSFELHDGNKNSPITVVKDGNEILIRCL